MGAFDLYEASAVCPRCGLRRVFSGQIKFFDPDYGSHFHRAFSPAVEHPIDFTPEDFATKLFDGSYLRIREPQSPGTVHLLAPDFYLCGCDCGALFAIVLCFHIRPGLTTPGLASLESILLCDITARSAAPDIDFLDGSDYFWPGNLGAFRAQMETFQRLDPPSRARLLDEALRRYFAGQEGV